MSWPNRYVISNSLQPTAYQAAVCCSAYTAEKTQTEIFHCVIKSAVGYVQHRRIISFLSCFRNVASHNEQCYLRLSLSLLPYSPENCRNVGFGPAQFMFSQFPGGVQKRIKIKIPSRALKLVGLKPPRGFKCHLDW